VNSDIFMPLEICMGAIFRVTRSDQLIRRIQCNKVTILMYHSVTPDSLYRDSCLSLAGMSTKVSRFPWAHGVHCKKLQYNLFL